jgi:uroporphyrin-III C-methyltransferase
MIQHGKVWLVGAGPGDVELLTLKAVRALGEADVVLIDDLVNREVLRFARANARVIEVGKRGGCRSTPQAFIERKLLQLAQQGLTVARVKGGDPYVFGRGGEEVETLCRAGIAVEVVNGITAGLGVPAALGIPVTHRAFCRGVTFITGNRAPVNNEANAGAEPDWHALARSGTTLVIYMGLTNLAGIASGLLGAGMPAAMPVAVVQNGTLPSQRSVVSQLDGVVAAVAREGLASPALVVVGEVVRFARVAQGGERHELPRQQA